MKVEKIPTTEIVLDPANARKHDAKNMEAIKGSLAAFGQQKPIVIGKGNVVVAGNGTLEAARALGWDKIDVVRTKLEGAEAMAFALADNRSSELAAWDDKVLNDTLKALSELDFDLGALGFDDIDFSDPPEPEPKPEEDDGDDEIPEKAPERAQDGDVFTLDGSTLYIGDCFEALRLLEDASVDALVTDPPAGISFMGKEWDDDKGGRDPWVKWMTEVMGECLRVLKPGAHGLVWALPRTSHWTATALENAGFEVRDVVTHLFGSGFPKSLDVSKAIDKAAGAEGEVIKEYVGVFGQMHTNYEQGFRPTPPKTGVKRAPSTDAAKQWQGWGTALKPANEHWILIRKPLGEKTVAANVLKHGTGGINIDGCRVEAAPSDRWEGKTGIGKTAGSNCYGANTQIDGAMHANGRFPANLILSHNPDCEQVGVKKAQSNWRQDKGYGMGFHGADGERGAAGYGDETVPAWRCTEGCAVAELDRQSGILGNAFRPNRDRTKKVTPGVFGGDVLGKTFDDSGGASRFFYVAKAASSDKGAANVHPTVKSTALMSYLIKLVTPHGALVLDPFLGSGTTLIAATKLGMKCVGCEKETKYGDIILSRWEKLTGLTAERV